MARVKKSAPDEPAGDVPSQSAESATLATPTKAVAKKGAAASANAGQDCPAPAGPRPPDGNPPGLRQIEAGPSLMVGIGASAGGYEALTQFFPALPPDTGMAFVVVQHLDPKHESLLPELLAKLTKMPVSQVKDRTEVQANQVYVIPPNTLMTITGKLLYLTARPRSGSPRCP